MSQCTQRYMSLCAVPKRLSPEGHAGCNAFMYLPFRNNLYFFGGGSVVFPSVTIPQPAVVNVTGVTRTGVYSKYSTETPCAG